jgi:formylglycine-generating enzyme required for sulfatase activity
MMQRFLALLNHMELGLDAEAIADALWLAHHISPGTAVEQKLPEESGEPVIEWRDRDPDGAPPRPDMAAPIAVMSPPDRSQGKAAQPQGIPFQAPAAPALRNVLGLGRSLRPLMRTVPSRTEQILDEEATATHIAESAGQKPWMPVFQPAPERWLELALVVEESRSTVIWQEIIADVQQLMERQGAFRTVRVWTLQTAEDETLELLPRCQKAQQNLRSRSPRELLDPTGRQLVLVMSDCVSPLWRQGQIHALLSLWSKAGPVAIVQFLPEYLWQRSALGLGYPVQVRALAPGVANAHLEVVDFPVWETVDAATTLTLPVVTLEPESLSQWAQVVGGRGKAQAAGVVLDLAFVAAQAQTTPLMERQQSSPEELVQRFRATASPLARRLASLMSVAPVSLPVVYLIQEAVLPASRQVHVAEVLMSGLLQAVSAEGTIARSPNMAYEFVAGVRELLQESLPKSDTLMVFDRVSQYIGERAGLAVKSFTALLSLHYQGNIEQGTEFQQFARIYPDVLRRLGGEYAALVEDGAVAAAGYASTDVLFPPLQSFEFDIATIAFEPDSALQLFTFDVATLEKQTTGFLRRITRQPQQSWQLTEALGAGVRLEMVVIPAGSFLMGSPGEEIDRHSSESPQHEVTLPHFFLGKYPVTQAQWSAVAALSPVNRELEADPSYFKGADRPVERVSWEDAVEFCDRLSRHTGKAYRLPSEAEWEYACRAGTTTPFHFGATITPDLANYDGNITYGDAPKGVYRKQTTPVGSFEAANAFGLSDMHGNVWEWCADRWHGNYEGAPSDGSAWLEGGSESYLLRGGSWGFYPRNCRSAYRYVYARDHRDGNFGFRVACSA